MLLQIPALLTDDELQQLRDGIMLSDGLTRPARPVRPSSAPRSPPTPPITPRASTAAKSAVSLSQSTTNTASNSHRAPMPCWRQFKFDHLCQLNFDQGSKAGFVVPGCG